MTTCRKGHPKEEPSTRGKRKCCMECRRIANRAKRLENKLADAVPMRRAKTPGPPLMPWTPEGIVTWPDYDEVPL